VRSLSWILELEVWDEPPQLVIGDANERKLVLHDDAGKGPIRPWRTQFAPVRTIF
jgi:hypothetical protein